MSTPTPPPGSTSGFEQYLTGANRDAYVALNTLFSSYGLSALAPKIFDFIKNGYSADTIAVLLQETAEYKQRFAGNEARRRAGLPVLNPSEYLATESAYRQIMQTAGLPAGFYDQPADFTQWIEKDVSPSEIQGRVDMATQATVLANPNYRKALNQMGIPDAELTAYFLDQKKALPFLQKSAATAAVGAGALAQGLKFDQAYAESLATQGVTGEQARTGYAQIGAELETLSMLGKVYGKDYTQRVGEQAVFEGQAEAIRQRQQLISQEKGQFAGAAGGGRSGLASRGGAR